MSNPHIKEIADGAGPCLVYITENPLCCSRPLEIPSPSSLIAASTPLPSISYEVKCCRMPRGDRMAVRRWPVRPLIATMLKRGERRDRFNSLSSWAQNRSTLKMRGYLTIRVRGSDDASKQRDSGLRTAGSRWCFMQRLVFDSEWAAEWD